MGYIVVSNFKANGVKGVPGKSLSLDDISKIGKCLDSLLKTGAVKNEGNSLLPPSSVPAELVQKPEPKPSGKKLAKG